MSSSRNPPLSPSERAIEQFRAHLMGLDEVARVEAVRDFADSLCRESKLRSEYYAGKAMQAVQQQLDFVLNNWTTPEQEARQIAEQKAKRQAL